MAKGAGASLPLLLFEASDARFTQVEAIRSLFGLMAGSFTCGLVDDKPFSSSTTTRFDSELHP
jgi:hypothetical protein